MLKNAAEEWSTSVELNRCNPAYSAVLF